MRVIIMGCGRVGAAVSQLLDREGHAVAVIDRDPLALEKLDEAFRGRKIVGVGFDRGVLLDAGIERDRIVLDPGFGFAKTAEQNFRLLDELATIVAVGYPVAVGLSRKRFLGAATGRPVEDRDRATAVACALAWPRGARLFRVHDVALTREALALASATTNPT